MLSNKKLIIIAGPTASGKTSFSIDIAKHYKTEIISADSRQIFSELQIGVAVPTEQQLKEVRHHFIHSHSIHNPPNVYSYGKEALSKINNLFKTKDYVIMTGGSWLYLKAVYHGIDNFPDPPDDLRKEIYNLRTTNYEDFLNLLKKLDPEYYSSVDKKNYVRVQRAIEVCLVSGKKFSDLRKNTSKKHSFDIIKFALLPSRNKIDENISKRLQQMRDEGLTVEAKSLYQYKELVPLKTIGYQELFDFFDGKTSEDEAYEKIRVNTRRYSKKQITWLNKEPDFCIISDYDKNKIIEKASC